MTDPFVPHDQDEFNGSGTADVFMDKVTAAVVEQVSPSGPRRWSAKSAHRPPKWPPRRA